MNNLTYLVDICDFQGGTQPPKKQWSKFLKDGYIRMLQIRDFTQFEKVEPEYVKYSTKLKTCKSDDILIARYGASLGKILTGLSGAYNVAIMKTIPNENKMTKKYLYYYFLSDSFQNTIKNFGSRAAQAGFNKEDLSLIKLKYPSIEKQEEQCLVLNYIYNLIDKRRRQILLLDKLVKSRFIEMFGEPDKNTFNWSKEKLGEHLDVVNGFAFKSEGFTDIGIPVLRIGNINSGTFKATNMVFWPNDATLFRYKIYPGDLVISLTGTVGKDDYGNVCILGTEYKEYYLNQRNAKLDIKNTINKYYLSQILKFNEIKNQLTGISRGVRQANISIKDILSLSVPIPPIELQDKFADFVKQTDKSKFVNYKCLQTAANIYRQEWMRCQTSNF